MIGNLIVIHPRIIFIMIKLILIKYILLSNKPIYTFIIPISPIITTTSLNHHPLLFLMLLQLIEQTIIVDPILPLRYDHVLDKLADSVFYLLAVPADFDLFVFVEWVPDALALFEVEEQFGHPLHLDYILPLARAALGVDEDAVDGVQGYVHYAGNALEPSRFVY